jgi:hypothetical protein
MSETNSTLRHEPDAINLRAILASAGALVAVAVVIHVGAWWLFRYLDARESRGKPDQFPLATQERQRREPPQAEPTPTPLDWSATRNLPPPPRQPQLEGIRRMEGKGVYARPQDLDRYEWVNRDEGIAQIPLEQAMALIADRGLLPARGSASAREQPSRANSGRTSERRQP